ncbi:interleukin-22 receptor subunit alpha-2 isoform X1 [Oryctolagus cuniculus]|uniref:Interleukin-22 receptor subunit alpha-2 n=1 Tax=Oryctolagus cuniculus TaxID=9986 RepID=G1TYE1_RABIT|nr:interleukin-22 receptor subunit alpha-2 isoform X1 [Oryctolagus cuniculus]
MMPKHCFLGLLIHFFLTGIGGSQPVHGSLKPQKVQFKSKNFHNVLHWQPGRMCVGNSNVYFVQHKMYGQSEWKDKQDCWGIRELFCDLTNETSHLQEPYYGRVQAACPGSHSDWGMSQRFTPLWETKIDPPVVNITQANGSALVILQAPDFPYRAQTGRNVSVENYYELVYRVFIINSSLKKERKIYEGAQRVVEISDVPLHSGYCVVAEIYQPMLNRKSQRSGERCVGVL